jgi:formiminotetrahydrofolate cyclodeaminase
MNKVRREQFEEAIGKLRDIKDELSDLCDEECEAYECMVESLRSSIDKSDDIEYELDNLDSFIENLEEIINE